MSANDCRALTAGYAWGLSGELGFWEGRIDEMFGVGIAHPEHKRLAALYLAGNHDGYLRYIKLCPELFLTPEQAAERRGIAPNNMWVFLRDEKRSAEWLMSSVCEGAGKRKRWHLHTRDVDAFPFRRKLAT